MQSLSQTIQPVKPQRIALSFQNFTKDVGFAQTILTKYHEQMIQPYFYNKEKVVRCAASAFALLAVIAFCGTGYSALYFTAAPQVVIKATFASLSATIITAATSAFCYLKKTFWNDPGFRAKMGLEVVQKIVQKQLPYKEIQKNYGDEIKEYKILTVNDLENILFETEVKNCTSFTDFVERNGKEALFIFTDKNKEKLKSLFLVHIREFENFDEVKLKFKMEIIFFDLSDETIKIVLANSQIKEVLNGNLNYFAFRQNSQHPELLNLNADEKNIIKANFIKEVSQLNCGLVKAFSLYKKDLEVFKIDSWEMEKIILFNEFQRIFTFQEFVLRNGADGVIKVVNCYSETREILRTAFLRDMSYVEMRDASSLDYLVCLEICKSQIDDQVIADTYNLTYKQFVTKHTFKFFDWLFGMPDEKKGIIQSNLKNKLLDKIYLNHDGLLAVKERYKNECLGLEISDNELEKTILPGELKCKDYLEFQKRNGENGYLQLLTLDIKYKPDLRSLFLKLPYKEMCKINDSVKTIIEIEMWQIEQVLSVDALNLSYSAFFEKHGTESFHMIQFSQNLKDTLYSKFLDLIKNCKIEEIKKYKSHCSHWQISLHDCYRIRWNNMRMRDILQHDNETFFKTQKHFGNYWEMKVLEELKTTSIPLILQNHKFYFNSNILNAESFLNGLPIKDLVEKEIVHYKSLEQLVKHHGDFLFKHHLIDSKSNKFKKLIKDYLNTHFDEIMKGASLECYDIIVDFELDKRKIKSIEKCKQNYELNLNNHNDIMQRFKNKCMETKNVKLEEIKKLENVRKLFLDSVKSDSLELSKAVASWEKTLSDVNEVKKKIASLEETLANVSDIKNFEYSLQLIEVASKITETENEIIALNQEKAKPVVGLKNAWNHGKFDNDIKLLNEKIKELMKEKNKIEELQKLNSADYLESQIKDQKNKLETLKEESLKAESFYKEKKSALDEKLKNDKEAEKVYTDQIDKLISNINEFSRQQEIKKQAYIENYENVQAQLKSSFCL